MLGRQPIQGRAMFMDRVRKGQQPIQGRAVFMDRVRKGRQPIQRARCSWYRPEVVDAENDAGHDDADGQRDEHQEATCMLPNVPQPSKWPSVSCHMSRAHMAQRRAHIPVRVRWHIAADVEEEEDHRAEDADPRDVEVDEADRGEHNVLRDLSKRQIWQ